MNWHPGGGPLTPEEERRFQEKWAKEPIKPWIMLKVLFIYFTETAVLIAGIIAAWILAIILWAL